MSFITVHYVILLIVIFLLYFFFFFNDTATTEIYTLSLHDALPISGRLINRRIIRSIVFRFSGAWPFENWRSEEHTSELQSRRDLVCRLLLEKKKKKKKKQQKCT